MRIWPQAQRTWVIVWLSLLIFGAGWIVLSRQRLPGVELVPSRVSAAPGSVAPDFRLETIDGESLALADLRGRPVMLNFWASWCGPCRVETPFLQSLHERQNQVVIVGINQGETAAVAREFADEFALTYPLLLDPQRTINRRYRVVGLPTTILIDSDGIIRQVIPGAASEAALEAALAAITAR